MAVGGGLGFTHNNQKTHPRLADVIGSLAALCQSCLCSLIPVSNVHERISKGHACV